MNGRTALQDTMLPTGGGVRGDRPVFVPAGTRIAVSYYALHRVPSVYGPDVEAFKPDRWNSISPSSWEYMPFGGGARGCVGRQKALAEASFVLVKIVQKFRCIESRDDREWAGQMKLTARNANGCRIALITR